MSISRIEVVSVEAWREPEGGWLWNNQFHLAFLEEEDYPRTNTARKLLALMREYGWLTPQSRGRVRVQEFGTDPEYVEIQDKNTGEPLLAVIIEFN